MHLNAFDGRAPLGPAGGAYSAPQTLCIAGLNGEERKGEGKGRGKGEEGKGKDPNV